MLRKSIILYVLVTAGLFIANCSGRIKISAVNTIHSWYEIGGDSLHTFDRSSIEANPLVFIEKIRLNSMIGNSVIVNGDVIICATNKGGIEAYDSNTGEKFGDIQIKNGIMGAPVYRDYILYFGAIGGKYTLNAYDIKEGKFVWRKEYGPFESSLAFSDDRLYAASRAGNIYCLHGMTGRELWYFRADSEIISGLLVINNTLYIGTGMGTIVALDTESGRKLWEIKTGYKFRAAPSSDGSRIFWGTLNNTLLAMDAETGKILWEFRTNGSIFSTPSVSGGMVTFGCADGFIYTVESTTGKEQWRYEVGTVVNTGCVIVGDIIYFGALNKAVYAVQRTDGTKLWEYPVEGRITANPAFSNGKLFIPVEHKFVYIFGKKE